jgi:hypothetical protein
MLKNPVWAIGVSAFAALAVAGCTNSPRRETPQPIEPPTVLQPPPSADRRAGSHDAPTPPANDCPAAIRVDPRVLTAEWPKRIGQRVRFTSRVERSVGLLDVVLIARGARFAAILPPDQLWQGEQEHAFIVSGSASLNLRGPVTLPQLVLDDRPGCGE